MANHGDVALGAMRRINHGSSPAVAWCESAAEVFRNAPASQVKGCPRNAFLGLIDAGLVNGATPGGYTRSQANKQYVLDGVAILQADRSQIPEPLEIWRRIAGAPPTHNGQMDVLVALWRNGHIRD